MAACVEPSQAGRSPHAKNVVFGLMQCVFAKLHNSLQFIARNNASYLHSALLTLAVGMVLSSVLRPQDPMLEVMFC
jgi:hypothetical protein